MAEKVLPSVFRKGQDNERPADVVELPQFLRNAHAADGFKNNDPLGVMGDQAAPSVSRIPPLDLAAAFQATAQAPVPRVAVLAGAAITQAADVAAGEIELALSRLLTLATDVDVEGKMLTSALRAQAGTVRAAIEALATTAQGTMETLRAERAKIEALHG